MINYKTKITTHRERYPIEDIEVSFESDRGRIISSAAFRRLQNRTQVFALELNSAVRSRLTHSLEVQQTARYIAKSILKELQKEESLTKLGLNGLEAPFVSIVEMAALLHDIGNPPFGHFAELTFNNWMNDNLMSIFNKHFVNLNAEQEILKTMLINDLSHFDGNAQAMRIIDKLQRYNLSYSQSAAVLKYTRGAFEAKPSKDDPLSYLRKKSGFYYSEKEFIAKMRKELTMKEGTRFPLTYIMEAADDIAYLTADIEDAVDKGILNLENVYYYILQESTLLNAAHNLEENYLQELVEYSYAKAKKDEKPYQFNLFLTLLRARLIGDLVSQATKVFIQNHEKIFKGTFNAAILEYESNNKYMLASQALRNVAVKHIYSHPKVETLELQAHTILTGLLTKYSVILQISAEDILTMIRGDKIQNAIANRLFKRLPTKHIATYTSAIDAMQESSLSEEKSILELYNRVRLLLDFISGMTDDFALKEFQTLSALNL